MLLYFLRREVFFFKPTKLHSCTTTRITFDCFTILYLLYFLNIDIALQSSMSFRQKCKKLAFFPVISKQIEQECRSTSQIEENWITIQMHLILFFGTQQHIFKILLRSSFFLSSKSTHHQVCNTDFQPIPQNPKLFQKCLYA